MRQGKSSRGTKNLNRLLYKRLLCTSTAFLYHSSIFTVWLEPQTSTISFLNLLFLAACAFASKNWPRMLLAMNYLIIAYSLLLVKTSVRKSLVFVFQSIFLFPACQQKHKKSAYLAFSYCYLHLQVSDSIPSIFALKKNLFNPIFFV